MNDKEKAPQRPLELPPTRAFLCQMIIPPLIINSIFFVHHEDNIKDSKQITKDSLHTFKIQNSQKIHQYN